MTSKGMSIIVARCLSSFERLFRLDRGLPESNVRLVLDGLAGALAIGIVAATPVAAQEKPGALGLGIFSSHPVLPQPTACRARTRPTL